MNAAPSSSHRLRVLGFILLAGCSQSTPGAPPAGSISLTDNTSSQASLALTLPDTNGGTTTLYLTAAPSTSQCLHVPTPTDTVELKLWLGDTTTLAPQDSITVYEWVPTTNVPGLLVSATTTGFTEEAAAPLAC
jgi:hypothetical protein